MKWQDILRVVLAALAAAVGAIAGIQAEKPAVQALLAPPAAHVAVAVKQ